MWMSKDTFLLEGGVYLKDNACQTKYGDFVYHVSYHI